jgi:hypothetical protein
MAFVRLTGVSDTSNHGTKDRAVLRLNIGNRRDGIDEQILGKWQLQRLETYKGKNLDA